MLKTYILSEFAYDEPCDALISAGAWCDVLPKDDGIGCLVTGLLKKYREKSVLVAN